jgi:hypothetical protein
MLAIATELACANRVYVDIATKFFEHFMYVADAINSPASSGIGLWHIEDDFFYDKICLPDGGQFPLQVHSLVGFLPLLAIETFDRELLETFPELKERLHWFEQNRPYLPRLISSWQDVAGEPESACHLLALVRGPRLKALLKRMLDPQEFLSAYGIRSLSKYHADHPYVLTTRYGNFTVKYEPAESSTAAFGGNSNWRGPIWFPINFLLIEALQKFHRFYGEELLVECPTGSGTYLTLGQVAQELAGRLTHIFLRDERGDRAVFGTNAVFQHDPCWRDYIPFYEYFHGETGAGLGASHQTGWTALIANVLEMCQTGGFATRESALEGAIYSSDSTA